MAPPVTTRARRAAGARSFTFAGTFAGFLSLPFRFIATLLDTLERPS
jgi:hypothetical protein